MPNASELLEQAAKSRDSAKRAHRLARTVNEADGIRLEGYRDQLLAEASDLERQAAALGAAGVRELRRPDPPAPDAGDLTTSA